MSATTRARARGMAAALALVPRPGAADPAVSDAFVLTEAAPGPAWASQNGPAAAFDGESYLVVWNDARMGMRYQDIFCSHTFDFSAPHVYAARVAPSGEVRDPVGIPLFLGHPRDHGSPAVACGDRGCLVVWNDGLGCRGAYSPVMAVRVDRSGAVLDSEPATVAEGAPAPSVSCDREGCLVMPRWCFPREPCGARVRIDGDRIEAEPLDRERGAGAVAFDGEHHVVVRLDTVAWLTPEGADAGFGELLVAESSALRLACGAGRCLLAWTADGVVKAARVAPGQVLDPAGIRVAEASGVVRAEAQVARTSGGYTVAWVEREPSANPYAPRILVRATVGDDGEVGEVAAVTEERWDELALASDGASPFAFLSDRSDVYGLDLGGAAEPVPVSMAAADQGPPAAASDGEEYLAVWGERGSDASQWAVRAARVRASGEVADAGGIDVAVGSGSHGQARLAWSGEHYVAVWRRTLGTTGGTLAARIAAADGVVLDEGGVPLVGLAPVPVLSCAGGACLAVWAGRSGCGAGLRAAPLDPGGDWRVGAARAVCDRDNRASRWVIAPDGDGYLLVWNDDVLSTWSETGPPYVFAAHLTADGAAGEVHELPAGGPQALAAGGAGFLVVWDSTYDIQVEGGAWEGRSEIHGLRLAAGGTPIDEEPIVIAAGPVEDWHLLRRDPVAVFDGEAFGVVWRDGREGGMDDLFAARVSEDGTVETPDGFAVSRGRTTFSEEPDAAGVALAADGAGRLFLAYRRFDPRPPHGSHRVHSRLLRFEALRTGDPCAGDWECAIGVCEAGTCCDPPCAVESADAGALGDDDGASAGGRDGGAAPAGAPDAAGAEAGTGPPLDAAAPGARVRRAADCGCRAASAPPPDPYASAGVPVAWAALAARRRARRRPHATRA